VVDAVTGLATLDWSAEARKQVILADRLVVTKTDLVPSGSIDELTARLSLLNPRAPRDVGIAGALDPLQMVEAAEHPHGGQRSGFIAEAEHSDRVRSFVVTDRAPIDWPLFTQAMETLVALRGADLLRAKGLLNVAGCRGPVVVQFVQHLAHPPVELAAWPDADRTSRLVFITRDLSEAAVKDLFAAIRALVPRNS